MNYKLGQSKYRMYLNPFQYILYSYVCMYNKVT